MDRLFDQHTPAFMPVNMAVQDCPVTTKTKPPATARPETEVEPKPWLVPALSGIAVAGVLSSVWLANHWTTARNHLDLEGNLLLMERLRDAATQADETAQSTPSNSATTTDVGQPALKPPALEAKPHSVTELEPLTIPVQPVLEGSPAPAAINEILPLLTGVVQGPGGTSSAIFQINKASVSSGIGDGIGNSGWTLSYVSEAGAVIQRNGKVRTLSVGGLF